MKIDLTDIEGTTKELDQAVSAQEIDLEAEDFELAGDAAIKGTLTKHIGRVEVAGNISATLRIECTRCLEPVDVALSTDFAVSYVAPEDFAADKEKEVGGEDLDTDIYTGERLDLAELVREQILLNVPEQIFCSDDCKGLCPQCGANRNLIDCKCEENETDPRWDALKNLK